VAPTALLCPVRREQTVSPCYGGRHAEKPQEKTVSKLMLEAGATCPGVSGWDISLRFQCRP